MPYVTLASFPYSILQELNYTYFYFHFPPLCPSHMRLVNWRLRRVRGLVRKWTPVSQWQETRNGRITILFALKSMKGILSCDMLFNMHN